MNMGCFVKEKVIAHRRSNTGYFSNGTYALKFEVLNSEAMKVQAPKPERICRFECTTRSHLRAARLLFTAWVAITRELTTNLSYSNIYAQISVQIPEQRD
uniref:Uncharacterized protein n=1 Tax=Arundo donax TaxID=35708 RepID=A0A0A8YG54_ARUDO